MALPQLANKQANPDLILTLCCKMPMSGSIQHIKSSKWKFVSSKVSLESRGMFVQSNSDICFS